MKKLFAILALCCAFSGIQAQTGQQFPSLEGESLTNQSINLPQDVKGKYTIIGLAYSKKSEGALKTWYEPAYFQFLHKPEEGSLFSSSYDVNLYFVPMFSGVKKAAYKTVMKKMKKSIDPKLLPYVLFYKGELKTYKKALNFKGKDVPYFFVLDKDGKIIYTTSGSYSDAKMQGITDQVDDAWN